jgi:putative addiction module CopG family antidote
VGSCLNRTPYEIGTHNQHLLASRHGRAILKPWEYQIMNVPLSENWQHFVREEVQSGRFPSETAVLEEALALLRRRELEQVQQQATNGARPIGEIIDELMSDVPDEVLDRLPIDGAAQHDHYIYATPKRPA